MRAQDGDGKVSYDEFLHRFLELQGQTMEDQLEGVRIQVGGADSSGDGDADEHKDGLEPSSSSGSSTADPLLQVQLYAYMYKRQGIQQQQQAAKPRGIGGDDSKADEDSDLEQPWLVRRIAGRQDDEDGENDDEDDEDDHLGPVGVERRRDSFTM